MAIHIVMDQAGDSRHYFDGNDPEGLAEAERRFKDLTDQGFTAAVRVGPGEVSRVHAFDPAAEETLFLPRLIGG
jgi:hypothetical protein